MKMFDAVKTSMIDEKTVMLSRFHLIPERDGRKDRLTDGRTDRRCADAPENYFPEHVFEAHYDGNGCRQLGSGDNALAVT